MNDSDMIYSTDIEMRVSGLQRSGNHAIINWVMEQFKGKPICFLNNIFHGNHDPFKTARQVFTKNMNGRTDIEFLRSAKKYLLIYSYEDDMTRVKNTENFLESIEDKDFIENKDKYIGCTKNYYDIIIVRDPFNMFASRIKKMDSLSGSKNINSIAMNWKSLALEAKNREEIKDPTKIVINYNEWFNNREYRIQLCKRITGTYSEDSLNVVAGQGGGSSFDSMQHSPITFRLLIEKRNKLLRLKTYTRILSYIKRLRARGAQDMGVLERWKAFTENSNFVSVFADRELTDLSYELFGDLPDTSKFVEKCQKYQ